VDIRDKQGMSPPLGDSSAAMLLDRLIDITLTYAIIIVVVAAVYPLLNKQLLQTF